MKTSKKLQASTTLMDFNSQQSLLQRTVFSPSGDKYTGEWLGDKKHGEPHYISPHTVTAGPYACNFFKGGGLRFGIKLEPFTLESGNMGDVMDTGLTACWSQEQRCMQRSTVANGKMEESMYVRHLRSRACIRSCECNFILF